jgi:hypothetical protein
MLGAMTTKHLCLSIAALALAIATPTTRAQSSFFFSSTAASWVGHGITETITAANGTIAFNPGYSYDHGLHLNMTVTNGENWSLDIGAPDRGHLQVGLYTNATRFPFNYNSNPSLSTPGLSFTGNSRGDNTLTGWFNVLSVAYTNDTLLSAAIDFVQYDSGNLAQKITGYVRFNSSMPNGPQLKTSGRTANAINFAWNTEPGQTYQLQYCTSLALTNWSNLGISITATNSVTTSSDSIDMTTPRFYRLKALLP